MFDPTSTTSLVSSRISRERHSSGVSPSSGRPPGSSHSFLPLRRKSTSADPSNFRNKTPLTEMGNETGVPISVSSRCKAAVLPHHVAMQRLHLVAGFLQPLGHLLSHHHAAMLAAGTTEGHGQVAFSLVHVMRQQIQHQLRHAIEELPSLRKTAHVGGDFGIE